jgi:hypothetical protein
MVWIEGLGWLTSRESAWWESDDGELHEFNADGRRTRRTTASGWAPRGYGGYVRRNDVTGYLHWLPVNGTDPRWTPGAIFTVPDHHDGVKACWPVNGRSKPVRAVPWVDWE